MATAAAFFDLDRTLMAGSSVYYVAKACYREGLYPLRRLVGDGASTLVFKVFGASDERSEDVRDRILGLVAGRDADIFRRVAPAVVEELLARIRPEAQALLDMHEAAGRDVYIVSASPVEVVSELARALDVAGGLGTESEIVEGFYTGQLAAPFCYGEGKAEVVRKIVADRGYDLSQCYAYADSASDLPILQLVAHPVAVNPDRSLMSMAHRRGWPVVEFNRQAKHATRLAVASGATVGAGLGGFFLGRRSGRRSAARRVLGVGRRPLPSRRGQ